MTKDYLANEQSQQKDTNTLTKDDTMMNKYIKHLIDLLAELTAAEYYSQEKGE